MNRILEYGQRNALKTRLRCSRCPHTRRSSPGDRVRLTVKKEKSKAWSHQHNRPKVEQQRADSACFCGALFGKRCHLGTALELWNLGRKKSTNQRVTLDTPRR